MCAEAASWWGAGLPRRPVRQGWAAEGSPHAPALSAASSMTGLERGMGEVTRTLGYEAVRVRGLHWRASLHSAHQGAGTRGRLEKRFKGCLKTFPFLHHPRYAAHQPSHCLAACRGAAIFPCQ